MITRRPSPTPPNKRPGFRKVICPTWELRCFFADLKTGSWRERFQAGRNTTNFTPQDTDGFKLAELFIRDAGPVFLGSGECFWGADTFQAFRGALLASHAMYGIHSLGSIILV